MARTNALSNANRRQRTIAIVGAGFSGTAVAIRLLRDPSLGSCRIVMIERAARFGPGLAYGGQYPAALLNVPAARMSLDEHQPDDFIDYLSRCGLSTDRQAFVPRIAFGDYLETRLHEAALAAPDEVELLRVNGVASRIGRVANDSGWYIRCDDGRRLTADAVVLATGHFAPRSIDPLRPLVGTGLYTGDPWACQPSLRASQDVLVAGTGLTMADVVLDLMQRPHPPGQIVAVSRHGLLPHIRDSTRTRSRHAIEQIAVDTPASIRGLLTHTRQLVERAAIDGQDWRDVIAGIRERVPELWRLLAHRERVRFLRHLQPYWDIHRHQLPPSAGLQIRSLVDTGRLHVRAARILSAQIVAGRVEVELRDRGETATERKTFDHVINCTGPDYNPATVASPLMRSLVVAGHLTPDPAGVGLQVDAAGRPIGRNQCVAPDLYYVGPWLRGRFLEATAVPELRGHASIVAESLLIDARGGLAIHPPEWRVAAAHP